ncbi:hypothetical protein EZS27_027509 [termite gut metagenome]|uniref:Uncharacterized protein n=1 Tax=termite gut metagenome TaxID=433724 RepID=A0A5J4QPK7_9ZZZZ
MKDKPVKAAKTNKSRIKRWLGDFRGVEISRSNSSADKDLI